MTLDPPQVRSLADQFGFEDFFSIATGGNTHPRGDDLDGPLLDPAKERCPASFVRVQKKLENGWGKRVNHWEIRPGWRKYRGRGANCPALAVYQAATHHGKARPVLRPTTGEGDDVFGVRARIELDCWTNQQPRGNEGGVRGR